ncbi:MAG: EAL domain-containing protein [Alphaproteobacteria bacterium]|nr:EAL domain-containing protein [Alphaproteobacteria bacterium]
MRLRYALISLFLILTAVPLTVFWAWPHSNVLQNEFDDVRDRHLLLARNLGAALERYHQDVLTAFNLVANNIIEGRVLAQPQDLLLNLNFRHICIAEEATGKVVSEISPIALPCPTVVPEKRMYLFARLAREDRTVFSEVLEGPGGVPVMYVIRRVGPLVAIGALNTDYFVRLGKAISFGVRGHAAIVDHKGNVLAHPLDDWIAARRNIAKVSSVARMLNGETGIETFYSPALKGDMIAGLTVVPEVGWGVMIPQPIVELQERARQAESSAITVFMVGLAIAFICAWIVSILFARPLEQISRAADMIVQGDEPVEIAELKSRLVPVEFQQVQSSFNAMVGRLRENLISIHKLAYEDKVTGLANRVMFRTYVTETLAELQASGRGGLMIFVDLDGFKAVNDNLGHDLGDELLRCFAVRLQALFDQLGPTRADSDDHESFQVQIASGHLLARLGGDEFAVFLAGAERDGDGEALAAAILRCVREPFRLGSQEAVVGASIGLARSPDDGDSYAMLIRHADMAMYQAKRSGKNTFSFYDRQLETALKQADQMRREIPKALQLDQFELHYQPRFHASSRQVRCLEALIRWNHPKDGQRLPGEFLSAVESSDAIIAIDHWVLKKALEQLAEWSHKHPNLALSINMSTRQLTDANMATEVIELVRRAEVDPAKIELEVTEHAVLNNEHTARQVIQRLHDFGLKIAIDDFGQGYSNFARFAELPVDVIKIDRSLIAKLAEDPRVPTIVKSLITMAEGLHCTTVAEGIEELEQVAILSELGCTEFQGYLFSKPLSATDAEAWLNRAATTLETDNNGQISILRPTSAEART